MNNPQTQLIEEKKTMTNEYKIYFAMRQNRNVLLTGGAGTGKTYVINKFIEIVDKGNIEILENNAKNSINNPLFKVARLATTGIAATHINGVTLDSFFGLRGCNKMKEYYKVDTTLALQNIDSHDCFCFDEVSMLRADKFEVIVYLFFYYWMQKIDRIRDNIWEIQNGHITVDPKSKRSIISKYENDILFIEQNAVKEKGFFGKGVLFSGDFMQIPPVVTKKDEYIKLKDIDKWMKFNPWIYCSETWDKCNFETILLTEVKRQDNVEFSKILNMIRVSKVSIKADKMLKERSYDSYDEILELLKLNNLAIPPVLCPTNKMVSGYNENMLTNIEGDIDIFKGSFTWNNFLPEEENKDLVFAALKNTLMEKEIFLKKNARIMFLVNDKAGRFFNGSVGTYLFKGISFDPKQKKYEDIEEFLREFREENDLDFKVEFFDNCYVITYDPQLMKKLRARFLEWRVANHVEGARKIKYGIVYKLDEDKKPITKNGIAVVDDFSYSFGTRCLVVSVDNGREIVPSEDGKEHNYVQIKKTICLEKSLYLYNEGRAEKEGGHQEKYDVMFSQFPVKLAYSVTFHKSQGMTMKSLIIDFNSKYIGAGAAYVALSRVERLEDLYLIGWSKNKVRACGDGIRFYLALEAKMKRLEEIEKAERIIALEVVKENKLASQVSSEFNNEQKELS